MDNTKDMTNDEFINHLMTGYSKHGALVQLVVIDCLQRGLDHYIERQRSKSLRMSASAVKNGSGISLINMEAWVACCEETQNRINEKYNG